MKIWIVLASDIGGSDAKIYGLFSTMEKADRAFKMLSENENVWPADLAIDCLELDILEMPVHDKPHEDIAI
jgi:hypothetical protein